MHWHKKTCLNSLTLKLQEAVVPGFLLDTAFSSGLGSSLPWRGSNNSGQTMAAGACSEDKEVQLQCPSLPNGHCLDKLFCLHSLLASKQSSSKLEGQLGNQNQPQAWHRHMLCIWAYSTSGCETSKTPLLYLATNTTEIYHVY